MEWDCIYFSSLVKNSFQILGPLTEIERFILANEYFLHLQLDSENLVGYLWVGFSKAILNLFGTRRF